MSVKQLVKFVSAACLTTWLLGAAALAHTIRPAVVSLDIAADGTATIAIRANVEVMLAGISPDIGDTNDSPQAADYDRLRALNADQLAPVFAAFAPEMLQKTRLLIDGQPVALRYERIDISSPGDLELARDSMIYLSTARPLEGQTLVWRWPADYGSNVLRINQAGSPDTYSTWLKTGQSSDPIPLATAGVERSRAEIAWNYLLIGYEHILPKGLDHILFVLGIFLLSAHLKPLLWQVTAFTIAHTITLGLSIYGVISLPASIVEPLIALSIAYVGIENCIYRELKPWRIVLVFMFGLLHGMGFAGVLTEIGLPRSEFLTALITFNFGVEFGQLTVIGLAFLAVGWARNRSWYRNRVVIPLSLLISVIGLYWTVERVI